MFSSKLIGVARSNARGTANLARNLRLDTEVRKSIDRKSKIVATIGPKSLPLIPDLLEAGMNVARINCSHGDPEYWGKVVSGVQSAVAANRGREVDFSDGAREDVCAIAFDTKGPEIRTGLFDPSFFENSSLVSAALSSAGGEGSEDGWEGDGSVHEWPVRRGSRLVLTTEEKYRRAGHPLEGLFVDYPPLAEQAKTGALLFVDDGLLALRVKSSDAGTGRVECVAENAGVLGERKGLHLPGVPVMLPAVSKKDKVDLAYAREVAADFVFASFVRTAEHVHEIRELVGPEMRIISKVETMEAVHNFDGILEASDGIMVARGDLGVDLPLERLFLVQKRLIAQCNVAGKPVITATQMLESMVHNPRPTRAECVDVANAILDGSDSVMLSGETAKGKFPVRAVETMARICQIAEAADDDRGTFIEILDAVGRINNKTTDGVVSRGISDPVESLAAAAVHASFEQRGTSMIVVITHSGKTARLVAKYRPRVPVITLVTNEKAARSLQLTRSVHSIVIDNDTSIEAAMDIARDAGLSMGICNKGDRFLALLGTATTAQAGDVSALHVLTV